MKNFMINIVNNEAGNIEFTMYKMKRITGEHSSDDECSPDPVEKDDWWDGRTKQPQTRAEHLEKEKKRKRILVLNNPLLKKLIVN